MGRDKTQLLLGDRRILDLVIDAVRKVCDEVVLAAGTRSAQLGDEFNVRSVEDPPEAAGPLAGFAAGLRAAEYDRCILVACDMPFLNPSLLSSLVELLETCDAAVPNVGGIRQPLLAGYSRRCLPSADELLRLGRRSMRDLLDSVRVECISEGRCRDLDPDGLSWFSINTPDDLLFARHLWERRSTPVAEVMH